MKRVAVMTAAAIVVAASCASPQQADTGLRSSPTPASTPNSDSRFVDASSGLFTSPLYGYSLELPDTDWTIETAERPLVQGESPFLGALTTDTLSAAGGKGSILIGAQSDSGLSLKEWTRKVRADTTMQHFCRPESGVERLRVDGEPAAEVHHSDCERGMYLWVVVVHSGDVWHIIWIGKAGAESSARRQFSAVLETFEFGSA